MESLPYTDASFDSVINTMAFTTYPDGQWALAEISRVLKPDGRIVMVDVNYPPHGNKVGTILTKGWKAGGDIIRDVPELFERFGCEYTDQEVGGFGSVHLYVGTKSEEEGFKRIIDTGGELNAGIYLIINFEKRHWS